MSPRLSFVVSLLAACGIHAVVLLAPRAAIVEEMAIPTVELDLAAPVEPAAPTEPAVFAAAASVIARRAAPAAAPLQPVEPIGQQQVLASVEPVEAEPPSAAGDGATLPAAAPPAKLVAQPAAQAAAQPHVAPPLVPPRPRTEILPSYPRSARRAGLEGVVKVSAMVDVSGAVSEASVLESSGHATLDQAALEAVRRARFAPALREGTPIACRIVIPIRFRLQPQENAP